MNVLIVCSGNHSDFSFEKHQAFIYDQVNAIKGINKEIHFETFFVKGKGLKGYLKNLKLIKERITNTSFDLIHAHNSVVGLFCVIQRRLPVVVTFHGSDINLPKLNLISSLTSIFANQLIFVSEHLKKKIHVKRKTKSFVIPCGVDLDIFNSTEFRPHLNNKILFTSSFSVYVKNADLAKKSISMVDENMKLIELKNKSRNEVNKLLNNVDLLLLTSFSEGSPQIIKEAMACNCPIVSTDVGDVKDVIGTTEGCYICSFEPEDVAEKIKLALEFAKTKGRTKGRQRIIELELDNKTIAKKIVEVYKKVLSKT